MTARSGGEFGEKCYLSLMEPVEGKQGEAENFHRIISQKSS